MPRNPSAKVVKKEEVVVPPVVDASPPAPVVKKTRAKAAPKGVVPPKVEEPVVSEVKPVEEAQPVTRVRKTRREVSPETVTAQFDTLLVSLENEVKQRKATETKDVKDPNIKYFKSLQKELKTLKTDSEKAFKRRQKVKRNTNTTSGFKKQVPISKEMTKFAGWTPGQLYSRNDVTNFICSYIKEHNLQNPSDRRKIMADEKLAKLLNYDPKTEVLTYYTLQRLIQPHFLKTPEA